MSPLSHHTPGTPLRIARIEAGDDHLSELATYGLVPGAVVHLRSRTPAYVVKVGETTLALDKSGATRIWVVSAHEEQRINESPAPAM